MQEVLRLMALSHLETEGALSSLRIDLAPEKLFL